MCAHLNGVQCAVIFCAVVVSALFHCTFDAFITFFHVLFPPHIWYRDSMCRFSEIITAYFSFFIFCVKLSEKGVESPMAEKKTTFDDYKETEEASALLEKLKRQLQRKPPAQQKSFPSRWTRKPMLCWKNILLNSASAKTNLSKKPSWRKSAATKSAP